MAEGSILASRGVRMHKSQSLLIAQISYINYPGRQFWAVLDGTGLMSIATLLKPALCDAEIIL
jgi:hypothetical protein